jgi:hypothetical protein
MIAIIITAVVSFGAGYLGHAIVAAYIAKEKAKVVVEANALKAEVIKETEDL